MKQARVIVHFEYVTEKKNDANKIGRYRLIWHTRTGKHRARTDVDN